jgi:hydrogenase expression/formation protein HypC
MMEEFHWGRLLWPASRENENMCIAIPVLIKSIEGTDAEGEIGGIRRKISLFLTPEARIGDYVLVHTGYSIGIIDQKEAEETLKLLAEVIEAGEAEN